MTRVLCWNVNNFGTNGFYPAPNANPRSVGDDGAYGEPAAPADARDRKAVLFAAISEAAPDLISILEVKPGAAALGAGALIADRAAYDLLESIQGLGIEGAGEFALVPPLVSGTGRRTEAIAVYYRRDRLQFLGPWAWSGAVGMPFAALPAGKAAEYPGPWEAGLPLRKIPAGWPNAGRWEDELAGQCAFIDAAGAAIDFPEAQHRKPWLTYFRDFSKKGAQRLIKLLSLHAPPGVNSVEGVQALARIEEIRGAGIAANEVRCVIGDFNVSSTDAPARVEAFTPLNARNFVMQFDPAAAGVGEELPWGAYYYSILINGARANPWISEDHVARLYGYPAFGYLNNSAIDNALTRHGAGAGAPAHQTICNPVTGSPYNLDPAAGRVPHGTIAIAKAMANQEIFDYAPPAQMGIDFMVADPGNAKEEAEEERALAAELEFQEWDNYTHIRSCSDHLPIALDI